MKPRLCTYRHITAKAKQVAAEQVHEWHKKIFAKWYKGSDGLTQRSLSITKWYVSQSKV